MIATIKWLRLGLYETTEFRERYPFVLFGNGINVVYLCKDNPGVLKHCRNFCWGCNYESI